MKSKYKYFLLPIFIVGFAAFPFISITAQTVYGIVSSQGDRQPIIGAFVSVIGKGNGTVTKLDGTFQIKASTNDSIEVRNIGCKTVRIAIKGRHHIDILLEEDVQMLEAIVVTGYQSISKDRATG